MNEIANIMKAVGIVGSAIVGLTTVGALLKIMSLFLQGLGEASAGELPIEILIAIISAMVFACLPWWLPVE